MWLSGERGPGGGPPRTPHGWAPLNRGRYLLSQPMLCVRSDTQHRHAREHEKRRPPPAPGALSRRGALGRGPRHRGALGVAQAEGDLKILVDRQSHTTPGPIMGRTAISVISALPGMLSAKRTTSATSAGRSSLSGM